MVAMRRLLIVCAAVWCVSCSPARLANAFVSADLIYLSDLSYGELERQRLDLYLPVGTPPYPAVIFVHGGYWDSGSKEEYAFVADALVAEGYAVAIPNYRLVPEVTFPAYVEDIAQATAWLLEYAELLELDAERIHLMGHSAGAHIAALVTLDARYLAAYGREACELASFVGLAGPYDFLPLAPDDLRARAALGPPAAYAETQPINFARGDAPPVLLVTGLADEVVDPHNSLRLAARLEAAGGSVQLVTYPGVDHAGIVGGVSRVARFLAPQLLSDLLNFFEEVAALPSACAPEE